MTTVKFMILMMSIVTVMQAHACYINFSPANVIWLFITSHTLMFYVMFFTVEFLVKKHR